MQVEINLHKIHNMIHILSIDDDELIFTILREIFSNDAAKYCLYTESHPIKALGVLAAHPEISICLIDIAMPEIDGFVLANYITRHYPTIVNIFLSAHETNTILKMALNQHIVYSFITKPFHIEELLQTIESAYVEALQRQRTLNKEKELVYAKQALSNSLEFMENNNHLLDYPIS
jgi:DNA-binding NtrC family response regulator